MTEVTRTVNNANDLSTAQSDISSLQESVNNNTTNISTLESYTVSNRTNFGVGPGVMVNLTTGTKNTALGNGASGGTYGLTTGNNNVMVGFNAGGGCEQGSNNTFLSANTQFTGGTYMNGSIGLGEGAIVSGYNQFMVASNITSFNISRLTASTGTGEGTILEFDSSGNIIPSAGTYNTVSSIDKIIATINAPYAMSWTAANEYTFDSSSTPQVLAIWDTITFGNSANMASASTWTCPAAGLWNISASYGISMTVTNGYVQVQLYHNGSSTFFTTFWVNVGYAGDGIVKNIESILLNLAVGDTLEWYVTTYGYTAKIGGGTSNGGTTMFNAVRIAPGYTAA